MRKKLPKKLPRKLPQKKIKSFARGGEPPLPRRGIARQVSLVVNLSS